MISLFSDADALLVLKWWLCEWTEAGENINWRELSSEQQDILLSLLEKHLVKMTDKQKLKDTTKKMIRATLTPAARGMKAREFLRQYKMDAMAALPFRELGYATPEDFYRDIPDVVSIRWEAGEMVLIAIPDEKTKHLSRMVANQRSNKSRSSSQRAKVPHGLHGAPRAGRRPMRYPPSQHSRYNSSRSQVRPPMNVMPTVPALLRGQIRELLFAYPSGLLGSNFDLAFSRRFGQQLNHNRMGFNTQLDLLKSINDIVEVELLATGGYKLHGRHVPRPRMMAEESHYQGTSFH